MTFISEELNTILVNEISTFVEVFVQCNISSL